MSSRIDTIECEARGTEHATAHMLTWPVPMPGQRYEPRRCPACVGDNARRAAARCDGTL